MVLRNKTKTSSLLEIQHETENSNYSSIDWIHESTNENKRKSILKTKQGMRGSILKIYDSAQGWILTLFIG